MIGRVAALNGKKYRTTNQIPEIVGTGIVVSKKDLFEGFWSPSHVAAVKSVWGTTSESLAGREGNLKESLLDQQPLSPIDEGNGTE